MPNQKSDTYIPEMYKDRVENGMYVPAPWRGFGRTEVREASGIRNCLKTFFNSRTGNSIPIQG